MWEVVLNIGAGIGIFVLLALGVQWARRAIKRNAQRQRQTQPSAPQDPIAAEERATRLFDPFKLQAGDTLTINGKDYTIRGTLVCTQGKYVWYEHLLDTLTGVKCYLSVEDDDGDTKMVLWHTVTDCDGVAGQAKIVYGSVVYELEESGDAGYASVATTGLSSKGKLEYCDYESDSGLGLSFESFDGGPTEVSAGRPIHAGDITYYPASQG